MLARLIASEVVVGEAKFDEVMELARGALARRRAEVRADAAKVEAALNAYLEALDALVLREFAVRNGLEVSAQPDSPAEAARTLRGVVLDLPELAADARVLVEDAPASVSVAEEAPVQVAAELHPAVGQSLNLVETPDPPTPPPPAVTETRVVVRRTATFDHDDNPPTESETRLRAFGSRLDAEGEVLKAEFEVLDFETLSDADFSSFATEFAARARLRQEKGLVIAGSEFEVRIIRRLTALAHQRNLPRPVYGLSRSHTGDWEAIAKRARDERQRRTSGTTRQAPLTQRLPLPATIGPPPAAVTEAADDDGPDEEPLDLPQLRTLATEAVVVLVGGTVKNEKLVRVRKRTGIDIDWVGLDVGKSAAAVTALAKRIRAGKIGALVLLNGLMDHKQSEPLIAAAREVDLPVAYADKAGKGSLVKAFVELEKRAGERAA